MSIRNLLIFKQVKVVHIGQKRVLVKRFVKPQNPTQELIFQVKTLDTKSVEISKPFFRCVRRGMAYNVLRLRNVRISTKVVFPKIRIVLLTHKRTLEA